MKFTKEDFLSLGIKNGEQYIEWINKYSTQFHIDTPNRIIAFFMNLLHESGDFNFVEELSSGDQYDTRIDLGNTPQKDGDGRKYKGRGLGQITGKYNYTVFTAWCNLNSFNAPDFVKYPEKVKELQWAVLSAFWFWEKNKLALYADKKLFKEVASIWNTGKPESTVINGLRDREKKAKRIEAWLMKVLN